MKTFPDGIGRKFTLASLATILAAVSPYVVDVEPNQALKLIVVIVVAYVAANAAIHIAQILKG